MTVCPEQGCNQINVKKKTHKKTIHDFRRGDGYIDFQNYVRDFQAFPGPLFTHIVWLFNVQFEEKKWVINFLWLEL